MWKFFGVVFFVMWFLHAFSAFVTVQCFSKLNFRFMVYALPLIMVCLMFGIMAVGREHGMGFMTLGAYYWLGSLFIFFCCMLLVFIANFFLAEARFYAGLAGTALALAGIITAIVGAMLTPAVKEVNITNAKLPVEELRIVLLSDTHLGNGVSLKRTQKLVEQVNALKADLVLVTGDFNEDGDIKTYSAPFKEMKAKYGAYGSLGNHEFYRGLQNAINFFESSNVKLLRQQSVEILPGIEVLGVDDINTAGISKKRLAEVMESTLDKNKFSIVMEHEPKYYDVFANHGANLVLSGHTHDGQIFPFNWLVRTRYPHAYGLKKIDNTYFYVTAGTFYWGPPMRLFTRNEITLITVTR